MKPIDQLSEDEFARLVQRAAALPDAPPALLRAAIGQWQSAQPSLLETAARAILRRVAAALTFDSWDAGSLAHGVRAVPSDTRHLLFSALGRDVDVRITPASGHFVLTGQILGPDESGIVELASAARADGGAAGTKVTALDGLGEFRLEGVPSGTYVLRLLLGEDEIVLPSIDVGERRA
ncbi:MAG: hypothetical protein IPI73_10265 [Betaproteobacteria bacterium]|nr:hypothetical protein [Betaproteobacteria bacterium]